jgi:hypothetical protein
MPTLARDMSLRWSAGKIARIEEFVATTGTDNFVHWTYKAQLCAARGDIASARSFIEHVLSTWSHYFGINDHFLAEVAVATLMAGQFDLVYDVFERWFKSDWRFEIEIVDDMATTPFVIEWEVVSRTKSVFRFDSAIYRSDAAHPIFLNLIWSYPLFDTYHKSGFAVSGRTLFTVGDMAAAPGLGFSANRPDVFLVPDSHFLCRSGYRHEIARLEENSSGWAERQPVVFWRGSTTGTRLGDWRTLQRVRLCQMAKDHQDHALFDVGISTVAQLDNSEWIAEIKASGLMRAFVAPELFGQYKYHVDIDGNSNAWDGLFLKLCTGSPVLKVASPSGFRQWYYDELKPWVNYVPVAADLADLTENIEWLRTHDDHAELIGKRGRALARSMTYESELIRAARVIATAIRSFGDSRRIDVDQTGG